MKKITTYLAVALMVAAMSVYAALASDQHHSAHIKISEGMMVGNTLVKKGEYKIRIDELTGELTVKKMNGQVVATAVGQVVPMGDDAHDTAITTEDTETGRVLTAVQIRHSDKKLILESDSVTGVVVP
jgi:hypothetical protein